MSFDLVSPQEVGLEISQRFKVLRLTMQLTREGLARRSGVSAGSLKRFETTGQISLESLLKLALVLGCLDDFGQIAQRKGNVSTLDEIMQDDALPKRGHIT